MIYQVLAVRSRYRQIRVPAERGTTLIELMVGMALMSIFGGMFTGGVVMMNRAENKVESVNLTSARLNQAFHSLDKTVRYAAAISQPARGTSGDWYVEFSTTATGTQVCTQLRVDSQQLQRRTWTVLNSIGSLASAWAPIASGITNGTASAGTSSQPFVANPLVGNASFQRLTVNLVSSSSPGPGQTTSLSSASFSALNSTSSVPGAPVCQEQGRP